MAKKSSDLVIVESPAKAKTIEKYLGEGFTVLSSYGHVRDLPERDLSVDVEHGFEPTYVIPDDKKDRLRQLQKEADKATTVWLATDEDREGEAISWHLKEALGLSGDKVKRITFNEITKTAVMQAIENPREIDIHLVDAQQARRVLDRLVGYELSPVLWRKVKPSLSAGRVQSVAVRIIVEREREILDFNSKSAFRITAIFTTGSGAQVKAELPGRFTTEPEAMDFLQGCLGAAFTVEAVEKKPGKRTPAAPFTTSTLQQEASRKLGYGVDRTMRIAQGLYEQGHITYMRTDSVNLSESAIAAAAAQITDQYGARYSKSRRYTSKSKGAQEAHEAIRPADMMVRNAGADRDAERLYDLIWKRTLASQMADAELEKTVVDIAISTRPGQPLKASGEVILFDGFLKVYMEGKDEEDSEEQEGLLPEMKQGELLGLREMLATQRFDRPAPRYTEASLVKKLEELGIGRPSTYAATISTVQKKGYVVKEDREGTKRQYRILSLVDNAVTDNTATENVGAEKQKLFPTDIGMVVNDFLVEHFPTVVDLNFTAKVEEEFDVIAEGKENWREMIARFYKPFHETIGIVSETAERATGARELGVDPVSGKKIYSRIGRFGPMIQIGEVEDEEKPRFASLRKDQSIQTITFQEALDLFKLPRTLGERDGEVCTVGIGRFGPYVRLGATYASLTPEDDPLEIELARAVELIDLKKIANATRDLGEHLGEMIVQGRGRFGPFVKHGKLYANIPKAEDPATVTFERAVELVEAKKAGARQNVLKEFEGSVIQILDGRYGPYITDGSKNANLPKEKEPADITLEEATALLAAAPERKGKGRRGARTAAKKGAKKAVKKAAKKKPAAKKATSGSAKASASKSKKTTPKKSSE
ncbi:MAG: type I DNA topoisomerase [Flavobacteriales bacterium]|jgi:DNA topoisomerase-1|nr:type I DNA topoisomerase [Flavobacteriales bacterium]MBK6549873.1 type I DNA topoisomerase [Flavobacteriales bacterium]MBK6881962.1 type I DNA topoisomerase [Flavobacteriales bacterium]MBK7102384.1 type I DNA topoisomerase [Flavobacteriales bacterium]MBK7113124.1 type I DNA topoisomerase [Flavobacteriales bacterium]